MNTSPTTDEHKQNLADAEEVRRPSWRYFIVANSRITAWGVVYLIIIWLLVMFLFPTLSRGEPLPKNVEIRAGTNQGMLDPVGEQTRVEDWDLTIFPWIGQPEPAEDPNAVSKGEVKISIPVQSEAPLVFQFERADAVEFYPYGNREKISRFFDFWRAPEAAKDQVEMNLYDVDGMTQEDYKILLSVLHSAERTDTSGAETEYVERARQVGSFMAFVMAAEGQGQLAEWVAGYEKTPYLGVPVRINAGVADLLRYQAGELEQTQMIADSDFDKTAFLKGAMSAVIASTQGLDEEQIGALPWFEEGEQVKMYFAVPWETGRLVEGKTKLEGVPTISFKSAWPSCVSC